MVTAGTPGRDPRTPAPATAPGAGPRPHRRREGSTTDSAPPGPSLTVAAVARRLGVAPATLRTWDRRYGLGPSEHLAGSHRRYSSADVSRLLVMRRLTLEGVAPSEAARTALDTEAPPAPAAQGATPSRGVVDAFADAGPMAPDPPALVAAAAHFDNAAVRWMLARVHPRDVVAWWTQLVQPALEALEDRAEVVGPGEDAVPALTAAAFAELRSRAAVTAARSHAEPDREPATVLAVAAAPGAELVVHVLVTALQEHHVRGYVLSVTHAHAVRTALAATSPDAVLVHVGTGGDGAADEVGLAAVRAVADAQRATTAGGDGATVFVHLEGAARAELPDPAIHRVRTLTGALHEVLATVG